MILDEPTANFDPDFREQFIHEITDFVKDGSRSVILATHQTEELDRIADYVTYLHQGEMVFSNNREQLIQRFRIIQDEDYKIEKLNKQRLIYKEKGSYSSTALTVHRKIDEYETSMYVRLPTIEDIMYYTSKAGQTGIEKVKKALEGEPVC